MQPGEISRTQKEDFSCKLKSLITNVEVQTKKQGERDRQHYSKHVKKSSTMEK